PSTIVLDGLPPLESDLVDLISEYNGESLSIFSANDSGLLSASSISPFLLPNSLSFSFILNIKPSGEYSNTFLAVLNIFSDIVPERSPIVLFIFSDSFSISEAIPSSPNIASEVLSPTSIISSILSSAELNIEVTMLVNVPIAPVTTLRGICVAPNTPAAAKPSPPNTVPSIPLNALPNRLLL